MDHSKRMADHELDEVGYSPQRPNKRNAAFTDDADMHRMGKDQQFQRNFQFISIAAFSVVAINAWCYLPGTILTAITNGGTGGAIVMYLVNWAGLAFVVLSLAEMSSIAPTAGGQYHWASEFAPPSLQKIASYLAGWLSSLSWVAGYSSAAYIIALTIQGMVLVNHPTYDAKPWQAYLLVVAIGTSSFLVNAVLSKHLPRFEGLLLVYFIAAFIAFMVVIWVLGPTLSVSETFGSFTNDSGWSSLGLGMLTGQSAIMFLIVGSDATAHMSEETKIASRVVPKAMITSYVVNAGLGFIVLVTYCFHLVDYDAVLESPSGVIGLPYLQVFINATNSIGGGTALVAMIISVEILSLTNWMASTARQVFAFGRDHGMPFGHWIAKVDSNGTYPVNALILVWLVAILLPLITLGSDVAFDALTSLQIIALIFTYLISMSAIIWRRLFGEPLPPSPWTLGKFALPINIIGWVYCVYQIIFLPWPVAQPVTPDNFNWASVMFVGIMAISLLYYVLKARHQYNGPVFLVRPRIDM